MRNVSRLISSLCWKKLEPQTIPPQRRRTLDEFIRCVVESSPSIEDVPVYQKRTIPLRRAGPPHEAIGLVNDEPAFWKTLQTRANPPHRGISSTARDRERKRSSINSVKKSFWRPKVLTQAKCDTRWCRSYQSQSWTKRKMKSYVQFLSTPTADTPGTTLMLHFDNKRYLIGNVAEGTQRAAVQRKRALIKVGDIFLTGTVNWGTTGGLLGLVLTIADSVITSREEAAKRGENGERNERNAPQEKRWLGVHGGTNLTHLLATARLFVFRKGMPIRTQEFRTTTTTTTTTTTGQQDDDGQPKAQWEPTWEDDLLKVWAMVIEPEEAVAAQGPRKRSHDQFVADSADLADLRKDTPREEDEQANDEIRKAVLGDMFDSEWRMDALFKKKLSEVKMPAACFVRNEDGKLEKYTGPMPEDGADVPDIEVLVRNPWPGANVYNLPPTTPATASLCYIIKNHPQRGKFDPQAAIKLGVPKGPSFRTLTQGQSITLPDGSVVTPEQVLGPGKEGGGIAVIELQNASYVEPLLRRGEWSSTEVMKGIEVVIWILGPGLAADSRIQDFMRRHDKLEHIVSSQDVCSNVLSLESPASAAIRLHLIDPERFPIPVHSNVTPELLLKKDLPFQKARVGQSIMLEPRFEFEDEKIIPCLDTAKVVEEASPEVQALADVARAQVTSEEFLAKLEEQQQDLLGKDAEVVTLGTGSALPSKYRNVSATLLRVPGYGNYLFDCGENTLGQLKRVFGDELPGVLRDLKAIWISHMHADHHLGTVSLIKAWNEETRQDASTKDNKLVVASDFNFKRWLGEYALVEDFGHDRVFPITLGARPKNGVPYEWTLSKAQSQAFGLEAITACPVSHCYNAMAVVFHFPSGFKVAYSGDCRPSKEFARIGRGATLLIHEATFDDELQGDAIAKKHSTTSEALEVGRQMGARRILLTHFSQRYSKIPVMETSDGRDQVVNVAFDYMRVKVGDMAKMEAFRPALMKLFEEKEKDTEKEV